MRESEKFLDKSNIPVSVSKISIMTGLQRPLVDSIRETPSEDLKSASSLLVKVIGAWQTAKKFTTAAGKPKILAISGKQSEFANLVYSVSQALNPYTVLFELERANLIEKTNKGIRLCYGTFKSDTNLEDGLSFLSSDINDLCQSVEANLLRTEKKNHHVTTEYDNIPEQLLPKVKQIFLEEGHKLHNKIRKVLAAFDGDISGHDGGGSKLRAVFTSFSRVHEV